MYTGSLASGLCKTLSGMCNLGPVILRRSFMTRRSSGGISWVKLSLAAILLMLVLSPAASFAEGFRAQGWETSEQPVTLRPIVKMAPPPLDSAKTVPVLDPAAKPSPMSDKELSKIIDAAGPTTAPDGTPATTPATTVKPADQAEIDRAVNYIVETDVKRLRRDGKAARKLARVHWLDRVAASNPRIIEAITSDKKAAEILAQHPRLGAIADSDHYVCRRLTRWREVARKLASNGQACRVIALDPAGIYEAVRRDRKIVRILSKNPMFDQMIVDNPDLGRVLAQYM